MLSEKPWKPELVIRLVAGLFASMMLGVLIVSGYESLTGAQAGQRHRDLLLFFASILCFHGVGLVLVNLFLRLHRVSWSEAFGFREPRFGRAIFLAVVMALLMLPIALSLTQLSAKVLQQFQVPVEPQQAVRVMQQAPSILDLVFHGFAAIVLAPFVEELVFRGILYPAVKQHGSRTMALWGTSIFFALTHSNLMILVPLTVLAIILTLLYETTNNLLAPIVTHSLFNAFNFGVLIYQRFQQGAL
jgi:membrane protease YdiL (CAAX protease family)